MIAVLEFTDFAIIGGLIALLAGSAAYALRPIDLSRLRRIDDKLDLILKHLGIDVPTPAAAQGLSEEVRRLADEDRKIEAIKVHREQTGLGLKEAKDAVEAYIDGKSS